jgi:2-amino-4-hydroxy-6-hydroxymethyldihydropteridine diphosphokinase
MSLHPVIEEAANGRLPGWSEVGSRRRSHLDRVAELLQTWAVGLELEEEECRRWRAVGYLHDALREADPEQLRTRVPPSLAGLPRPVLHGPAAAERLRIEGVTDGELLRAVSFHTIGDPRLARLGRALYCADFLEPGRSFLPEWRATLRDRMPGELDAVCREVVGARIRNLLERGKSLLPQTVAFWNALVGGTG